MWKEREISVYAERCSRKTNGNASAWSESAEKWIEIKDFSIIIGRMLLKSIDRGENVYLAMKARGFDGEYYIDSDKKISRIDIVYFVSWTISFIIL